MTRGPAARPAPGFNVFGYLSANLGLGVSARNTAGMLIASGYPVRLTDVDPGGGMRGRDTSLAAEIERSTSLEPFAINLFHINPDQVLYLLDPLRPVVAIDGRLNAAVPFWELPRLPDAWIAPLAAMDVILAPTLFIREAVLASLPDADVVHYPQAVRLPEGITGDRAKFDLPEDAVIFVSSFDMRSDIERKNPFGAIEAFVRAFPGRDDVRLVVKANNVETGAGLPRHLQRLRDYAADPRVTVLSQQMSYAEILTLYASCDVLVSLHRAEGLGLSLLEAMSLGVPVVATAWSGNMDFCTPENSCLVPYDMVAVKASTQPAYGKGMAGEQSWAEPRLDDAAAWLCRLADDPSLRASLGSAAAASAARIRADYDRGDVARALVERLGGLGSPEHARHESQMRALRRRYWWNMARRLSRSAIRRVRTRLGVD